MSIPLKMLFITVVVGLTTFGVSTIAMNFAPAIVFFLGFLWGTLTNTAINMFLTFTETK